MSAPPLLMPGCRPAPFGPCPGRPAQFAAATRRALPQRAHSYGVRLACGPAQPGTVDRSGRRVEATPGLEYTAGCQQPWRPGGPTEDDGQQLQTATTGPAKGARRATLAFVAPGSKLMQEQDGDLPGAARVVGIEAVQALLRANTTDADVVLRTNALAERARGIDRILGCTRGRGITRERSAWRRAPSSRCDTSATAYLTARGEADRIAVPRNEDVREVVWEVGCPGPCDPEGGPFAARVTLKRATIFVQETDAPEVDVDFGDGTAKVTVADLMGIDRIEVRAGGERLSVHDTRTCRPTDGRVISTRIPCPRDADRRVTLDVRVPPARALQIVARDALGNVTRRSVQVPQ